MQFRYIATDQNLEISRGTIAANSSSDVAKELRKKGLKPVSIKSDQGLFAALNRPVGASKSSTLSLQNAQSFCRDMYILLRSGIQLHDALKTVQKSAGQNSRLTQFTKSLSQSLIEGGTLSDALLTSTPASPADMVAMIKSGEQTGTLDQSFELLSEGYADRVKYASQIGGAFVYPAFLLFAATVAFFVITFFVVPNISGLFAANNAVAPPIVAFLEQTRIFIQENLLLVLAMIAVLLLGLWSLFKLKTTKIAMSLLARRTPILGTALKSRDTAELARMLHVFVEKNIPATDMIETCLGSSSNLSFRTKASMVGEMVQEGSRISDSFATHSIFDANALHMLGVGEKSGKLGNALKAIAASAQVTYENRMKLFVALLVPTTILLLGAILGTLIFSVFQALLSINELAL